MDDDVRLAGRFARSAQRGAIIAVPLAVYCLAYRAAVPITYTTFSVPALGAFPKGILLDLSLILVALAGWALADLNRATRALYLIVSAPLWLFAIVFRATDYYYYSSVHVNFNAFALYRNIGFVQEGAAVVLAAPLFLLLAVAVVAHGASCVMSARYASLFVQMANASAAFPRTWAGIAAAALALAAVNARAVATNPHPRDAARSLSGEYVFLEGFPRFYRPEVRAARLSAPPPALAFLPAPQTPPGRSHSPRRPNIFLISIESFNYAYLEPASLNRRLTREIMPYFKTLTRDGHLFTRTYTSSAYTTNGYVATLCSQPTVSESVWGADCLPEVLAKAGYETRAFISLGQLLPKHYETFRRAGFDPSHVFDAVKMREGRSNIYFDFMVDREVFDFAAAAVTELARGAKPMFVHVATNQMHVPGFLDKTTCAPFELDSGLTASAQTRNMIGSAHCTDRDLEHFILQLKAAGLYDDALIVITADHAINIKFWDYQEPELARIPLFIKFPRAVRDSIPVDTTQLASQLDIAPTILDFVGAVTTRPLYGRSLLSPLDRRRVVVGVSASRLISLATSSGVTFYDYAKLKAGGDERGIANVYDTIVYFDQHPALFEPAVRQAAAGATPRLHLETSMVGLSRTVLP